MLNLVREGEEDYIEAIRYRRRLKIFENFLFSLLCQCLSVLGVCCLLFYSALCTAVGSRTTNNSWQMALSLPPT